MCMALPPKLLAVAGFCGDVSQWSIARLQFLPRRTQWSKAGKNSSTYFWLTRHWFRDNVAP